MAFYRYAYPSLALAAVVLAALGIDVLASRRVPRAPLLGVALASFAIVCAATLSAVPLVQSSALPHPIGSTREDRCFWPRQC